MSPFPGPLHIAPPYGSVVLDDEQADWFRRWFPVTENERLARAIGISHSTLHRLARTHGLTKSEAGYRAIMKRHGRRVRRQLEDCGYYDTLRGRRPSQNAIDATIRLRATGWHPMQNLSPQRRRAIMKRKGEQLHAIYQAERRRAIFGLPKQTNLHITLTPYTRSQVCRRSYARRCGYILSTDITEGHGERYIIYYDAATRRMPIFETNCLRDGFTFRPIPNA